MCVYFLIGLEVVLAALLIMSLHYAGVRDSKAVVSVFRQIPKPVLRLLALAPFTVNHDDESIDPRLRRAYRWIGLFGSAIFAGLLVIGLISLIFCWQ